MPVRAFAFILAVGFLALTGCGPAKLDETKNYELEPGDIKAFTLPAQPKPQRLTVEFEATSPIEVAIFKAEEAMNLESLPMSKALATEKAKTTGTLTVDLGPDVSTTVVVTGLGKKSSVKVHLTNKR